MEGHKSLTTKNFKNARLPSAVINQNIREVKILYRLFEKSNSKKENIAFKNNQPICYNNQNYRIDEHFVSIPLFHEGKCKRFAFPLKQTERFESLKDGINKGGKLGKSSLFHKRGKWYFAVTIKVSPKEKTNTSNVMGVDIGLRQLAVASIQNEDGQEINRQFHHGNQAGFVRKKYRSVRRSMGKAKKPKLIQTLNDKESRWMMDLNHKISRQLINLAVQEQVDVIVMENLENIRNTAKSLRKTDRSIHHWSFFQLQQFIEYKATLEGIEVEYINPKYTSQRCSRCKEIKKSNRKVNVYTCKCGNNIHSDLNASRNIAKVYTEQQSA